MTPRNPSPADQTETGPTLLQQMGGVGGLVASVLPVLVFVPVNAYAGLTAAIWSAVGVAVGVAVWRLVRREPLQPAISGLLGVAIAAFIAYRTGSAKGYFLFGIWSSLVFAAVFGASVAARWPLVGVIWHGINGDGQGWRADRALRHAYVIATVTWTVVFAARFVVQKYLYDADSATSLGVARIAMGIPLTAAAVLVTIWAVRRANRRTAAAASPA
ncbi:MAG: DUF3159 domain-containing protein [Actinomycetota bacterium]|nr:DUF3159 domain-containing protein [Actinomycetota bacterium]